MPDAPAATKLLVMFTMGGFGLRTLISITSLEVCPLPVAVTVMRSTPVAIPDCNLKNTCLSVGEAKVSDCVLPSVSRSSLPVVSTFTVTFFTLFSIAKTLTGR